MGQVGNSINIVCLESEALKSLVKQLAFELTNEAYPWIDEREAMKMLRIGSKTTFQKYRDSGDIDFRRITPKHILYRRQSILDFIENKQPDSNG